MIADFKLRNSNRVTETRAEEYLERRNIKYVRYGLDSLDSELPIYKIPPFVRSAPDYILFTDYNSPLFFEAKGFKECAKFKIRDLKNYREWNKCLPVIFFLYNVKDGTYCEVMFNEIERIIRNTKPEIKAYPESINNKYYEIPISSLPDFTNF